MGAENVREVNQWRRLYALDLLRFIAALAVVLCHWCYRQTPNVFHIEAARFGAFGVHLFFLISGFVILMSAQREDFRGFVVARIVRLYPAFWICCTITFLFVMSDGLTDFPVYLSNMTMFPPHYVPYLNEAYWTLALEAQFYGLIAALLLVGQLKRVEWVMWGWLALSAVASNVPQTSLLLSKLLMSEYSPFFVGGCACYLLRTQPRAWALLGAAFVLAMQQGHLESLRAQARGVEMDAGIICGLYTLFFVVILAVAKEWVRLPASKALVAAGATSYPLYLLHQRIGVEVGWTTDSPLMLAVAVVWIVTLSWAVHRYGERPLQRVVRRWLNPVGVKDQSDVRKGIGAEAKAHPVSTGGVVHEERLA